MAASPPAEELTNQFAAAQGPSPPWGRWGPVQPYIPRREVRRVSPPVSFSSVYFYNVSRARTRTTILRNRPVGYIRTLVGRTNFSPDIAAEGIISGSWTFHWEQDIREQVLPHMMHFHLSIPVGPGQTEASPREQFFEAVRKVIREDIGIFRGLG